MATHYSSNSTIHNPNYNNNNNDHFQVKPPSLQEELRRLPRFSPKRCIYRVPRHLRMANEGVYTPLVVSIGPLHHHEDHLQATKFHKLKYLQSFLDRSRKSHEPDLFLGIVREHEFEIRGYYADPMVDEMESEELVKMVLVDATFLIELFCRYRYPELINRDEDDQMFHRPRMVVEVSHDICLEENQLPLFILCELYKAAGFNQGGDNFINIACAFLNIKKDPHPENTYNHFLDLLRFDFLPLKLRGPSDTKPDEVPISTDQSSLDETKVLQIASDESGHPTTSTYQSCSGCFSWKIPRSTSVNCGNEASPGKIKRNNNTVCKTATALHEAGVKFVKADDIDANDSSKRTQLDIEFDRSKGTLSIPKIVVQDDTEAMLKNLAVFEQCHYFDNSYIIDYLTFLDFLINTPEDVALLAKEGIIESWLGSDERVAELFNGLNKYLRMKVENFYYNEQTRELDEYYNRPWNRHRAVLKHKYFHHPWATISVVYAVALLLLTVLQAATGVISAFPSK